MSVSSVPPLSASPVAPILGHDHTVQFYGQDTYLLDELCRYIGTALVAGESAIVIATKAHREGLAQEFKSRGVDTSKASDQGRYFLLDAEETLAQFMVDGWPDEARFEDVFGTLMRQAAASSRNHRISAFGEMVALLWAKGRTEAAFSLEQLWNKLTHGHPMSLRCAYRMSGFDREDHGDLFLKICAEHSRVVPVESYTELISDEQRLRSITHLQQKAQALENEMVERKKVEETLRRTKADLESQVQQRTAALRRLSSRLLILQDSERRRIARELHDSLGQYLVGLKLNVDMLRQSPDREELWAEAEALMQQCIQEVRTLSYLLHPPTMDAAGFASAARWYVEGFSQRSSIRVTLEAPADLGRLPDAIELALFRVLQEALTNVHRHSGAASASVFIQADAEQVVLEVRDNGHGIPQEVLQRFCTTGEGVGVGLAGIGERVRELGGKLQLESDSNGTVVQVAVPLAKLEVAS